jgi:hypothetical protein
VGTVSPPSLAAARRQPLMILMREKAGHERAGP